MILTLINISGIWAEILSKVVNIDWKRLPIPTNQFHRHCEPLWAGVGSRAELNNNLVNGQSFTEISYANEYYQKIILKTRKVFTNWFINHYQFRYFVSQANRCLRCSQCGQCLHHMSSAIDSNQRPLLSEQFFCFNRRFFGKNYI